MIPTLKIVPGDIIELRMGDKVPADCRIIESNELKINNWLFSG